MYQALYRKYRPKSFDEVIGQEVIVKTLKNSIKNNKVSHAYLFTGPRGTGKTSIAKIFAKILNCHNLKDFEPCNKCISCEQANNNQNIDIIEIDAASNNGVDEIREIRNKITLVPTNSKYKIYIIDEVHMLTNQAFNALLKTLEEPPSHIIFIFATTEPQKIPRTILSRCQRFDYKKVSVDALVTRLKFISQKEKIKIDDDALREIAILSDGGVRDSISLLDQALSYSDDKILLEDIHAINGTLTNNQVEEMVLNILNENLVEVISLIEKYDNEGKNIIKIVQEIIDKMKDILLFINSPSLVEKNEYYNNFNIGYSNKIINLVKNLSISMNEMKNINNPKLLFEIEIIKNLNDINISQNNTILNKIIDNTKQKVDVNKSIINNVEIEKKPLITKETKNVKQNKSETLINLESDTFKNFKQNRINNSLSEFSKKERETFKSKLEILNDYIDNDKYSKLISIIQDGEFKSITKNYLMFMYKSSLLADSFNIDINNIEQMFSDIFKDKFNVIAINSDDWEIIRKDYNKNKDKYVFKNETISFNDLLSNDEPKSVNNEDNNSIDDMFNDIIVYE